MLYEEQKRLIEEVRGKACFAIILSVQAAAKQAKEEAMMIGVVSEELAATVVPKSKLESKSLARLMRIDFELRCRGIRIG